MSGLFLCPLSAYLWNKPLFITVPPRYIYSMKIGILFGGPSREREISFAGGRTVYDNLDKTLFEPVPIFIDSRLQPILLDWPYLYKGTIRDFYPPLSAVPDSPNGFQIYIESLLGDPDTDWEQIANSIGQPIRFEDFPIYMDAAFLALHGSFGEDGQIQGMLESLQIPYTGSGILPSSIGINKAIQKRMMQSMQWPTPTFFTIPREVWDPASAKQWYNRAINEIGRSIVIRPAHQGSSIGVRILHDVSLEDFTHAVEAAFFHTTITHEDWQTIDPIGFIRQLTDIREGVGLPVDWGTQTFYHPEVLLEALQAHFAQSKEDVTLVAHDGESEVVVEAFVEGKEFSCIVIRNEDEKGHRGEAVALPPTEIIKGKEVFDYRSKYLAGLSRKITPINLPEKDIEAIRKACEELFDLFGFHVYARIDGFIQQDGTIYLNDPNTTSGMLPSSFFFHQAAEIGLNPSQFLTYILRTSIAETVARIPKPQQAQRLLQQLDAAIRDKHKHEQERTRVGVILGGYSAERHISVESGRNIYEKLASSATYEPTPIFLKGSEEGYTLYQLPINLLLKDNADDISDKIDHFQQHPVVERIKEQCAAITAKYAAADYQFEPVEWPIDSLPDHIDFAFLGLHGRPGEDGQIQQELERLGIPYNGSGPESAQITIDKHITNQILREHGFSLATQYIVEKEAFEQDVEAELTRVETAVSYPLIAKPVDDGCSSAVKKIANRDQLRAFLETIFREQKLIGESQAQLLHLKPKEEFPHKQQALIESLIDRGEAKHFLEITGGMLIRGGAEPEFEVFEPSEALATDAVLSLEEKFLAGEGQNLTPARFAPEPERYRKIAEQVKHTLQQTAALLGVRGYCRIDAFVRIFEDDRAETLIIEVNSLPGMTPATVIFHQAALNGYKPFAFIDRIIQFGFERKKEEFSGNVSRPS